MPQTDLETLVFQMDANITKLDGAMRKAIATVDGGAKNIEGRLKKTESAFSAFGEAPQISKSLDKIFDSTRLAVIDAGAEKLRLFGSALEPLGGIGIAAAAGVAALGAAMEKAKDAADWAEDVKKASEVLGTTAGSVQELQFGGQVHGIDPKETTEELEKLNEALGKVQAGGPRAKRVLQELGMSQEEVERFQTIDQFLPELADRLKNLSPGEAANLAEKMGISKLLPLLQDGAEGLQKVRDRARELGIVLGDSVVDKAAAANQQLNEMQAVMNDKLRQAFVDMIPMVEGLEGAIANLVGGFAELIEKMGSLGHVSAVQTYMKQITTAEARIADLQGQKGITIDMGGIETQSSRDAEIHRQQSYAADARANLERDGTINNHAFDKKGGPPKPRVLIETPAKKGPEDQTNELDKTAQEEIDSAMKEYAGAMKALAGTLEARKQAETAAVDDDTDKKIADLHAEAVKIAQSKNDKDKQWQLAQNASAQAVVEVTAALKKEAIARNIAAEAVTQASEIAQGQARNQEEALSRTAELYSAQAALTNSASERVAYERQALSAQQDRDWVKAQADVTLALAEVARAESLKDVHGIQAAQINLSGAIDRQTGLPAEQALQIQEQAKRNQGPLAAWASEVPADAKSVGDALQKEAVKGIDDFNRSLADSIVNSRNFGDAFRSVLKQIEADLIQLILKQAEVGIFGGGGNGAATQNGGGFNIFSVIGSMIPHFAGGTDNAPGGLSLVGENGPELVQLPGGSGVTPNSVLRSLSGSNASKQASQTIIQGPQFHLESPVVTQDLIAQFSGISQQHATQAALLGAQGGKQMALDAIKAQNRYAMR